MLRCISLFLRLFLGCAKRRARSAGGKGIGNRTGWERIEAAQLGEEHPDLVRGAEGDNYGREERGVRQ